MALLKYVVRYLTIPIFIGDSVLQCYKPKDKIKRKCLNLIKNKIGKTGTLLTKNNVDKSHI